MTAVAELAFTPARELPNGQPFYSEYGSFSFQADEVGEIIDRTEPGRDSGHMPIFDTGTGKTIISLAAAAFLFTDGKIDQVVVIAELNAVDDWREATEAHTTLSAHVYHGSNREKRLAKAGVPHVFITTYETGAAEFVHTTKPPGRRKALGTRSEGPLVETLGLTGKRTLWVFDECFVAGTLVDTPGGARRIEHLRVGDEVLNAIGTDRVSSLHRKRVRKLVRISTDRGDVFTCSETHPFFSMGILRQARDLRVGDELHDRAEAVRVLQGEACLDPEEQVLREELLLALADDPTGDQGSSVQPRGACEDRSQSFTLAGQPARGGRPDTAGKARPLYRPRGGREDQQDTPRAWAQTVSAGRQRPRTHRAPAHAVGGAGRGVGDRAHRPYGEAPGGRGVADSLQDRLGLHRGDGSGRGGWDVTQQPEAPGGGSEEGRVPARARVARIEVLEPGSPEFAEYSDGGDSVVVYDIEVERHHSFSVHGALVHNCTKLRNRSSGLYRVYDYLLSRVARTGHHQRRVGLTATPMSRNYGDGYNIGRIMVPERMPTVGEFEAEAVAGHDDFGHPVYREDYAPTFARYFQGVTTRKRKTDPEVACHFPRQHEAATHVALTDSHAQFYETIETLFDPAPGELDRRNSREVVEDDRKLWNLLRITAGHPAGHLHAQNDISQAIAEEVGPEALRSVGASKVGPLLTKLDRYRARGWPVVVFSFYKVVLFELARELDTAGYTHVTYHGGLTRSARQKAYNTFRAGDTHVFLASDAAARGMNLQVSPAVVEYESSSTYLNRTQRLNRVHRLTSPWSDVWCDTLILNGTVEEATINLALNRNAEQDLLVGDDEDETGFISAETRRKLLKVTRRR